MIEGQHLLNDALSFKAEVAVTPDTIAIKRNVQFFMVHKGLTVQKRLRMAKKAQYKDSPHSPLKALPTKPAKLLYSVFIDVQIRGVTMLKGLYGITDSQLLPDDNSLLKAAEQALHGGMKVLQYRDKSDDHNKRLNQAGALKVLCHQHKALLIINDDVELAASVEADGVHVGQSDTSVMAVRERLGEYAIIGVSCEGSIDLAQKAVNAGANYVAFGKFFESKTKPDAKPANISLLPEAKQRFKVPVVAIGGITVDNAPQIIEAGADMIAVVNNLFAASDIQVRARALSKLYQLGK